MLRQGQGERVPCKEQYQQNDITQHRGRQPPSGWILNLSHPFTPVYFCRSVGHKRILLLLIVLRLAFFLEIELGLFLCFLITLIFFSCGTHVFLLFFIQTLMVCDIALVTIAG